MNSPSEGQLKHSVSIRITVLDNLIKIIRHKGSLPYLFTLAKQIICFQLHHTDRVICNNFNKQIKQINMEIIQL
jgi:hypothetical protein